MEMRYAKECATKRRINLLWEIPIIPKTNHNQKGGDNGQGVLAMGLLPFRCNNLNRRGGKLVDDFTVTGPHPSGNEKEKPGSGYAPDRVFLCLPWQEETSTNFWAGRWVGKP